jgi:hypothetical protein
LKMVVRFTVRRWFWSTGGYTSRGPGGFLSY